MKSQEKTKRFGQASTSGNLLLCIAILLACNGTRTDARTWTSINGKTFEGEFILVVGDKAVIRNPTGDQIKIPLTQFSKEDLTFMELENPPKFTIDVSKSSEQYFFPQKYKAYEAWQLPKALDYVFTTKLRQMSTGSYKHELRVDLYVIGEEIDGDNYIMLDRQSNTFIPSEQPDRACQFKGTRKVRMFDYEFFEDGRRGQKYGGYLVVITDSRGKVIAQEAPQKWLIDIVEPLQALPFNAHFNKTGKRVFPPRPKMGR